MANPDPELLEQLESMSGQEIQEAQEKAIKDASAWIDSLNQGLEPGMTVSLKKIPGANFIWGTRGVHKEFRTYDCVLFEEKDEITLVEYTLYIDYWKCHSNKYGICFVPARLFDKG